MTRGTSFLVTTLTKHFPLTGDRRWNVLSDKYRLLLEFHPWRQWEAGELPPNHSLTGDQSYRVARIWKFSICGISQRTHIFVQHYVDQSSASQEGWSQDSYNMAILKDIIFPHMGTRLLRRRSWIHGRAWEDYCLVRQGLWAKVNPLCLRSAKLWLIPLVSHEQQNNLWTW